MNNPTINVYKYHKLTFNKANVNNERANKCSHNNKEESIYPVINQSYHSKLIEISI